MSDQETRMPYGTALIKSDQILKCLAGEEQALGVSEIARKSGLNKATVFKLLETLQSIGYVEKHANASYSLGIQLLKLAQRALSGMDLIKFAMPYLQELNDITGEAVHLGVLDEHLVTYVAKLESKMAIRMYSNVGKNAPLYCTGIGKALLATYSDSDLSHYLRDTVRHPYTVNTLTTEAELLEEVQRIRLCDYAIDNSEHEEEVRCVATSLTYRQRVYGAVSISAPGFRADDKTLLYFWDLLKDCKQKMLENIEVL